MPLTLAARESDAVVGTVILVHSDLEARPDLSPWASLYVVPDHRGKGIGSLLIAAVVQEAKLGFSSLFLFTQTSEALYAKRGWQKVDFRARVELNSGRP